MKTARERAEALMNYVIGGAWLTREDLRDKLEGALILYAAEKAEMAFNDYTERSKATAFFPKLQISIDGGPALDAPWLYPLLGLLGEAGELAEKYKKLLRDDAGALSPSRASLIQAERGDVLWYLARLSEAARASLEEDATLNVEKLESRYARGKLSGDGDDR